MPLVLCRSSFFIMLERCFSAVFADNSLGMNGLRLIEMTQAQCFKLLNKHQVKYKRLQKADYVKYPVQILSPIAGIRYTHTRRSKKYSVMDCRLVVALVGLGPVLKEFKVTDVYHMRTHTNGARVGGKGRTRRHHWALAIDIARLVTVDGENMDVKRDWADRRKGADPCVAQDSDSKKHKTSRRLICKTAQQDIFHWILTPHYNKAHYDHFHVEIRENIGGNLFQ